MNKRNLAITAFAASTALFSAASALATELYLQGEHTITLTREYVAPTAQGSCEISNVSVPTFQVDHLENTFNFSEPLQIDVNGALVRKLIIEHLGTTMTYENENNETVTHEYAADEILLYDFEVHRSQIYHFGRNAETLDLEILADIDSDESEYIPIVANGKFAERYMSDVPFVRNANYETRLAFKCYTE